MKKFKLVVSLMLALTVITLAFAACDNTSKDPGNSGNAEHVH